MHRRSQNSKFCKHK